MHELCRHGKTLFASLGGTGLVDEAKKFQCEVTTEERLALKNEERVRVRVRFRFRVRVRVSVRVRIGIS